MKYGVQSEHKVVLGFPIAKQIGLEHGKENLRGCDHWSADPPPLSQFDHDHRFNAFFIDGFPNVTSQTPNMTN